METYLQFQPVVHNLSESPIYSTLLLPKHGRIDVGKLINHNSFRDFISFKNFMFINKNNSYSGKTYFMFFLAF